MIYQNNINEDINIINYKNNYILNTSDTSLINQYTPQIVETETYEKTYIMNLGKIESKEEFDYGLIDKIDNLVLETGIAFIENGFNISKTSNNIYLHRNTLIYRLDKIKDVLGMDIRNFNEACVYYIIVKDYLMNKNL